MSAFTKESGASEVAAALSTHIVGKVVLITGCSPNSLAETAAFAIAAHNPALIILAGKSQANIEKAEENILSKSPDAKTRLLIFDLASLESIRKAAAEVHEYKEKLDVIINSAGIMATPYEKTVDGFESQFGVNHLGPFLFTNLLVGKLAEHARILNVTSGAYELGGIRFEDPNFEKEPYNKWTAYAQSKTANILYSAGLAERLGQRGIRSYSVEIGGGVFTNLGRHMVPEDFALLSEVAIITHEQGSAIYIVGAFDPAVEGDNGAFLQFCKVSETKENCPWARGKENKENLWALSEKLVGQKFDFE